MNLREKLFLRRLRAGDRRAAERLIKENYARAYGLLFRLTKDPSTAEDLTQETFLRVWRSLSAFEGKSSLSTWIHKIAYNVFLEHRRAKSINIIDARVGSLDSLPDNRAFPDILVMHAERDALLREAVDGLPEKLREVIYLHYCQELSIKETADVLGIATSTVKYRVRAGLDVLRRAIGESDDERSPQEERRKGRAFSVDGTAKEAL